MSQFSLQTPSYWFTACLVNRGGSSSMLRVLRFPSSSRTAHSTQATEVIWWMLNAAHSLLITDLTHLPNNYIFPRLSRTETIEDPSYSQMAVYIPEDITAVGVAGASRHLTRRILTRRALRDLRPINQSR